MPRIERATRGRGGRAQGSPGKRSTAGRVAIGPAGVVTGKSAASSSRSGCTHRASSAGSLADQWGGWVSQSNRAQASSRSQFKTREVVDLLDLSRRQLQYWAKTGLIEPSERTPGGHHRYSFDDLVALKATKRLIDAGVSVQKIRKSVRALQQLLPQVGRPLSELVLVATGDVVLVFRDDTVFEAITGQEWVFEVADFEREVSAYRARGARPATAERANGRVESEQAGLARVATNGDALDDLETPAKDESLPDKPGPRGTKPGRRARVEDWSRTG